MSTTIILHFSKNKRNYIILFSFVILSILSTQETLLETIEGDLGNHMIIEHALFFLIGALSVLVSETLLKVLVLSSKKHNNNHLLEESKNNDNNNNNQPIKLIVNYWIKFIRKIFALNRHGFLWLTIAIILMSFWHIPSVFDYASISEPVHVIQHISFIAVGVCGFMTIRAIRESFNIFLLFSLIGMMGFAGLMLAVLDKPIYKVYTVSSHNNAGTYMIILSMVLALIVFPAYLIHRTLFHIRFRSQNDKGIQQ